MDELPIPTHLKRNFALIGTDNNEYKVSGRLVCECGSKRFAVLESNDRRIDRLVCRECSGELLLFDAGKHGWNGFVCKMDFLDRTRAFNHYCCAKCGSENFEVTADISSQGKQDFMEECVSNDDSFTAEDWVDGFEWITVSLLCCDCNNTEENWLDLETM